jgi:hypothetical protein
MYIVERIVPGLTAELLAETQRCLAQATRRVAGDGPAASYLRCISIPEQDRCLDLFEAASADTVRRINDIAQVPFRWIAEASDVTAPGAEAAAAGA